MPTRVGRTSFVYDAAGRVIRTVTKRISKKPLVRSFYYATGAQPIGFDSSDQPGVGFRYVYDGLKRRVAKETIDTATGNVTERVVFAHAGDQLVAEHTTVGADRGRGFVWTTDPGTGEIIGQITLAPQSSTGGKHRGGDYPHGENLYGDAACRNPSHGDAPRADVSSWPQDEVDAEFFAIVTDLAGAPHEIIHPDTGDIVGTASQTLYGQRTWRGDQSSPLLFAGQYADVESGWAYNRFRYYNPHAGIYNAQDPLGAPPRLASAQGYVDHAAFWVDVYGLKSYSQVKNVKLQERIDKLTPNEKGKVGETIAKKMFKGKFDKDNFRTYYSINDRDRITDITLRNKDIVEVKFTKKISLDRQLQDGLAYAKTQGSQYHLVTAPNTHLTRGVLNKIESGDIVHRVMSTKAIRALV